MIRRPHAGDSGKLRLSGPRSAIVYKWMAITFGIGMALLAIEIHVARKKKEGFTPADRQRVVGIFLLSLFMSGLVGFVIWAAAD
jgi:hypothetical protein